MGVDYSAGFFLGWELTEDQIAIANKAILKPNEAAKDYAQLELLEEFAKKLGVWAVRGGDCYSADFQYYISLVNPRDTLVSPTLLFQSADDADRVRTEAAKLGLDLGSPMLGAYGQIW